MLTVPLDCPFLIAHSVFSNVYLPLKMDNPETLAALSKQDTGKINVRENRMDNQEWTIQRHCQHLVHEKQAK
jgi:hypothetical protein